MDFYSFELNINRNLDTPSVGLQLSAPLALWAKRCLTEILEGHILCLDRGEEPEEACTTEDSEAEPTASDPWLQGCMPVVDAAPQQTTSNQVHFFIISGSITVSIIVCVIYIPMVFFLFFFLLLFVADG